ncbi:hypothetical protein N431DRAFT_556199 [Stipitochalara longipes BDJ]|nr:hypothetical protein N431DRAFT_556199 [Stipitochalara longipes BDJ]
MCLSSKHLLNSASNLGDFLETYLKSLLELVIDARWSRTTLNLILNECDETQRHELINTWKQNRLDDLERINLIAALVAGVISSAFSWYNITESPWSTKALWYCGLLFAMAAITTGGVHSAGLHRLSCHPLWHEKLREALGTPINGDSSRWRPRTLQPIIWQTPNTMLKLSITCFLVGLVILIWDIAENTGVSWMNNDMKVAILFTIAATISFLLYVISVFGFFFKTVT